MIPTVPTGSIWCTCDRDDVPRPHIPSRHDGRCPPYVEPEQGGHAVILSLRVHSKKWDKVKEEVFGGDEKRLIEALEKFAAEKFASLVRAAQKAD